MVAPLASLKGLFIAVYAIARGANMTALLAVGVALAVIGGALAAMQGRARSTAGAAWALLTSALWTLTVICFDQAGEIYVALASGLVASHDPGALRASGRGGAGAGPERALPGTPERASGAGRDRDGRAARHRRRPPGR